MSGGISERVRQLNLPLDQVVVIGSGVLDAAGLRVANDIDLVLKVDLFAQLVKQSDWRVGVKRVELVLEKNDVEAFLSWTPDGRPNFEELYAGGVTIDGVRFAHPNTVINWKRQRASEKDLKDIALLEGYLAR